MIFTLLVLQTVTLAKVLIMSASLDRLKLASTALITKVTRLEAQVTELQAQLAAQPPPGTPDAELDAVSAQLESAVSDPAVAPVATP